MAEYIDREKIQYTKRTLEAWYGCQRDDFDAMVAFKDEIDEIPAADVRPVITCGKCKYGKYTGTEWFCDKHSGHADKFGEDARYHEYHSKHWFCADGEERKHE